MCSLLLDMQAMLLSYPSRCSQMARLNNHALGQTWGIVRAGETRGTQRRRNSDEKQPPSMLFEGGGRGIASWKNDGTRLIMSASIDHSLSNYVLNSETAKRAYVEYVIWGATRPAN